MKHTTGRFRLIPAGLLLLAGVIGCSAYFRDGPSKGSPAYRYHPYHYHYYPGTEVCFHIESGFYFSTEGEHWQRVRALPPDRLLDRHDRIPLWIADAAPYRWHEARRGRYPPGPAETAPDPAADARERKFNHLLYRRYHAR